MKIKKKRGRKNLQNLYEGRKKIYTATEKKGTSFLRKKRVEGKAQSGKKERLGEDTRLWKERA